MIKTISVSILVGVIIGVLLMKRFNPPTTQIVTQTVDRIVTHEHTVTHPDGTKETDTTTHETVKDQTSTSHTPNPAQPQWNLAIGIATQGLQLVNPIYKVELRRRILGPISLGAFGTSNGLLGVGLSVDF